MSSPPVEYAPDFRCPHCGHLNDSRTAVGDIGKPVGGDVSICFYCGGLAIFVGHPPVAVRRATVVEERALRANPLIRELAGQLMLHRLQGQFRHPSSGSGWNGWNG